MNLEETNKACSIIVKMALFVASTLGLDLDKVEITVKINR